jgi:hypothetical protein
VRALPPTLKYQPGVIAASGNYVIVHGRFSGNDQPRAWIAADVCRIANGVLAEHWDVLQDEATKAESKSGLPMFGQHFADSTAQFENSPQNRDAMLIVRNDVRQQR